MRNSYRYEQSINRAVRPMTPQQDLRWRARAAAECLVYSEPVNVRLRLWLVHRVEEAALAASPEELVDLEQVMLVAGSAW